MSNSRRDILASALPAGAMAAVVLGVTQQARAATLQSLSSVVTGAASGTSSGTFIGSLALSPKGAFSVVNGTLVAAVTLIGNVLDSSGTILQTVNTTGTPVQALVGVAGSCQILSLTLGPLHLNLLGLVIDLNQVVLTINAVAAPGNLLGNLLCDIAHLLDSGGAITTLLGNLAKLLNGIIGLL